MPNCVWYACYGSNLLLERFLCYIEGGTAPGGQRANPGARDNTNPLEIRPYIINRPLYFAGEFQQWQGQGVGFLEIDEVQGQWSHARIYKITSEQFDDVVLQENGLVPGSLDSPIPRPDPNSSSVVFDSSYGRIMCLEFLDGNPVYTFTRPDDFPRHQRCRPSPQYLSTIMAGLLETKPELNGEDVIAYFMKTEAAELGSDKLQNILNNLKGR